MRNDGERHARFLKGEFDASELSLALYLALKPRNAAFVALPIFPNRRFRHAFVYLREESSIREPQDLIGKAVGIPSYLNTCGLWVRGMLKDDYGVAAQDITWKAARSEREFVPPAGMKIEPLAGKKGLRSSLLDSEVDAVISPEAVELEGEGVRRLFRASKEVEKEYYSRTKIFPISHAVVVRQHVIDKDPQIVHKLFAGWSEAKRIALEDDRDPTYSNFAWIRDLWEEERTVFGEDPWPYGLARNKKVIDTLIRYGVEQGILKEKVDPTVLFYPIEG
jgi:4,5-dihydroxyphthalate decarboxylase